MTERELFEKVTPEFLETLHEVINWADRGAWADMVELRCFECVIKNVRADLELETKSCL